MRVDFYEPPPAQKVGGLDQAVCSLRDYLGSVGFSVRVNPSGQDFGKAPQVVHFHGLWQWRYLSVSRWCRRTGTPYVVSPHGMLEPWAWRHKRWKKLVYYHLFEKPHLQTARVVLATSDQESRNLERFVPDERIATIPLALSEERGPAYAPARRKLGWDPEEVIFLYLSRVHPKKGLHLLISSLCSIAESLPKRWRLVIVGEGEEAYVSKCRHLSQANENVSRNIEWKGAIWGDAKWDFYQGADLFCLPSFSENFGLVIPEACQVGTRVLTTRYTPWSFLEDKGAAVLVEPAVESVGQGLVSFLKSKPWTSKEQLALASMIHERFGWQKVGGQYVELYQQLCHSFGSVADPKKV